jgi:hypothetical protein
MSCDKALLKNILSDCTTAGTGGLEVNAWLGRRSDLVFTYNPTAGKENIIINVENAALKKCIKITGIKKLLKAGHTAVIAENRPNKFTQTFSFEIFERLAADFLNMDQPDDVVAFIELKDKTTTGEGVFVAIGVEQGLYTSADAWDSSANNGVRTITLSSMAGQEEKYSRFVVFGDPTGIPAPGEPTYATTLALLQGLTVAGA